MRSIQPDTGVSVTIAGGRSGGTRPPSLAVIVNLAIEAQPKSGPGPEAHG